MISLNEIRDEIGRWLSSIHRDWDQFWFAPRMPSTLCILRILTGAMLLYGHLVLASDLNAFVGEHAWINNDTAQQLHDTAFSTEGDMARSYLWHLSDSMVWVHHLVTIVVTMAFMAGLFTRFTGPAAWLLQLMYVHRLTGALFGLDQIVTYCAMYLAFTTCGSRFSVDALLRERFAPRLKTSKFLRWLLPVSQPTTTTNIATRLLQIHLCVIYLFGGLAKARGEFWWDGTAVWYSVANYEYQSFDMTWLAAHPRIFSALSNVTMFWEIFYCVLVWPYRTRWIILAVAVGVHGGIALFLGMATFGLMMIAANLIFVEPQWIDRIMGNKLDQA